jgi:hypothetical protein
MMKALLYKVSWAVLVLWLFFFALSSPAPAQDKDLNRPLVASGTRPMMEQDSADARKLALEEALRAAVEQGLGWLLPSDRIILKEPMSYIQDYQIVHEGVTFGLYRVTVLTTLYTEGLNRKLRRLGLFLAASERPRIAILVAERTSPEDPWHWWWQTSLAEHQQFIFSQALAKLMSDQGLVPLDPNLFLESLPEDPIYQEPMLADEQGGALAKALGADVAMLGQVTHQPGSTDSTGMASGSLRAMRVESGKILARVSGTVQVQPSSEYAASDYGFTALAERLAPHLVDGVLAPFVAVSRAPKEVTLQVEGVRSYGDLILIKEHLQRAPVVKEIRQIQLKADLGSFTLVLAGDLKDLESALEGHDFGTFVTSADVTDANLIAVTILSKR